MSPDPSGVSIRTIRRSIVVLAGMIPALLGAQESGGVTGDQREKIDRLFSDINPENPGCAVAIYRRGEIIYRKGFGSADLEHGVRITPTSRFDIGSTAKQFTAASILLLEQDGLLTLDDDVRKWIPELPDYGEVITIRHLLHHTSGLRDYIGLLVLGGADIDDVTTDDDALRMVVRQQGLDFSPGSAHSYSNTGYFLASVIVKRASGRSLREFAAERIFRPLGMSHTTYIDDHTEVLPGRAIGYSPREDGEGFARDISNWEQNGDGGLFTTVEDLALWDGNFYSGKVGGERLLSGMVARDTLTDGSSIDYALGLFHTSIAGREALMHGGAWGGYRAELARIPSEGLAVAVLSNDATFDPSDRAESVLRILLGEGLEEESGEDVVATSEQVEQTIDLDLFDEYVGDYRLDIAPDVVLSIYRDGPRYLSRLTGQSEVEIYPSSDSTFFLRVVEASLSFQRNNEDVVTGVTLHQGGNEVEARRVNAPRISPTELDRFVGTWYSPELDRKYVILRDGENLVGTFGDNREARLEFDRDDRFAGSEPFSHQLRFVVDEAGDVTEMRLSYGRGQGILFERVGE